MWGLPDGYDKVFDEKRKWDSPLALAYRQSINNLSVEALNNINLRDLLMAGLTLEYAISVLDYIKYPREKYWQSLLSPLEPFFTACDQHHQQKDETEKTLESSSTRDKLSDGCELSCLKDTASSKLNKN